MQRFLIALSVDLVCSLSSSRNFPISLFPTNAEVTQGWMFVPYLHQGHSQCHYFQRMPTSLGALSFDLFCSFSPSRTIPMSLLPTNAEVTQVPILGPNLFLIYIKDLPNFIVTNEWRGHSWLYPWTYFVSYFHQGTSQCHFLQRIQRSLRALYLDQDCSLSSLWTLPMSLFPTDAEFLGPNLFLIFIKDLPDIITSQIF